MLSRLMSVKMNEHKAKGLRFMKDGDISDALREFHLAEDAEPGLAVELQARMGTCCAMKKDWSAAVAFFSHAVDEADAERDADAAQNKNTTTGTSFVLDADFYFRMGEACFRVTEHSKCVAAYETALALGKGQSRPKQFTLDAVHYHLGTSYAQLRQCAKALRSFEKVKKPDTVNLTDGDIACAMEACHTALGDDASATRCMRVAISSPPVLPSHAKRVAMFWYRTSGDVAKTVRDLESILVKNDDAADVWYDLGRVQLDARCFDAAEEALVHAAQRAPDDPKTWLALGELYAAVDDTPMALKALQRARELDGSHIGVTAALAKAFETSGQVIALACASATSLDIQ